MRLGVMSGDQVRWPGHYTWVLTKTTGTTAKAIAIVATTEVTTWASNFFTISSVLSLAFTFATINLALNLQWISSKMSLVYFSIITGNCVPKTYIITIELRIEEMLVLVLESLLIKGIMLNESW